MWNGCLIGKRQPHSVCILNSFIGEHLACRHFAKLLFSQMPLRQIPFSQIAYAKCHYAKCNYAKFNYAMVIEFLFCCAIMRVIYTVFTTVFNVFTVYLRMRVVDTVFTYEGSIYCIQGRRVIRAWGCLSPQIKLSRAKNNDTLCTVQCASPPK